jgi:hypothetical protein
LAYVAKKILGIRQKLQNAKCCQKIAAKFKMGNKTQIASKNYKSSFFKKKIRAVLVA